MKQSRMWIVARREWRATVLRREFLMVTFALPLIFLMVDGAALLGTSMAMTNVAKTRAAAPKMIAIYDPAHVFNPAAFTSPVAGTQYVIVGMKAGQEGVISGAYKALLTVPPDVVGGSTPMTLFVKSTGGVFDDPQNLAAMQPVAVALRAGLVWGKVPEPIANRVSRYLLKTDVKVYNWSPKVNAFVPPDQFEQVAKFFVPFIFALLLLMSILMGTGYLLHGIVEEKENRVMEVLLSSVSHEELLRGKMLGLGGAGLAQMFIWVLMGGLPLLLVLPHLHTALRIDPEILLMALILFALGFAFYGSIIAALGSLGSSYRESQQLTTFILIIPALPVLLMPTIMDAPHGALARTLSWLPPTAPIALMLRSALEKVPLWDVALGIALLIFGIWAIQKISARVFRMGLLMYGKAPSVIEIFRWLKAA